MLTSQLIAVAVVTILAVISPGADFAMTVRNSSLYGRTAGLLAAAGIALGVLAHVSYTVLGVGIVMARTPQLLTALKYVGAGYLVYIGYKTFIAGAPNLEAGGLPALSRLGALRTGFLTNVLNPKTMLFVVSTYTQVVSATTPLTARIGYGVFISLTHLAWFSLAALVLSRDALRARLLRGQVLLNRAIGTVLVALGIALAWTPLAS